jgi:hypothetical protein
MISFGAVDQQQSNLVIGTVAFLALTSAYLLSRPKTQKKQRRLSFTSVGLGLGTFPPKANVKEPIINAALYFDDCPAANDVAETIVKPLLTYERLSQVPDLENHTCRPSSNGTVHPMDLIRELDIDGDVTLTNRTIVEHCQDTLGAGRKDLPWWEILIIRNRGKGSSACVIRIHHVIGDGLALVGAFNKILTNEDGTAITSPISFQSKASSSNGKKKKSKRGILSTAWSLVEATGHVLTLGATKYDDDTVFSKMNHSNMHHSGKREAVIFPTIPLEFVKQLKTAANVTVNDLLMTAVSQAITDYCKSQNDAVLSEKGSSIKCRALLPVGFPRSPEELSDPGTAMRNIWCMVSCDIGVGISNIEERLRHVHSMTTEMKEKPRAFMQLTVQNKLGPFIPTFIGQQTVFDTFSRHSLVLTNVPGPSKTVLFAGKPAKAVQLFFDNLLTQVDLISYAGNVYGNMIFDSDELPNSEIFGQLYAGALVELAMILNVDVPAEVKKAACTYS